MSVSYIGQGGTFSGSGPGGGTVGGTLTVHGSTAVDDLLVVVLSGRADAGTVTTPPAGFSLLGSVQQADTSSIQHLYVYTKVATSGDISAGATVLMSGFKDANSRGAIATMVTYRGVIFVGDVEAYGATNVAGPAPFVVPDQPAFGEGKIVVARAANAGGSGLASGGTYTNRGSTELGAFHLQGLADGDYDSTPTTPTPHNWTSATTTKVSVAFVLSGTAEPTPPGGNRGPFIGLRVN